MQTTLFFIGGLIIWSFTEYFLHRFLGHEKNWSKVFKKEHFNHHKNNDQFTKVTHKIILALAVGMIFFGASFIFLPLYSAIGMSIGFVFGYAFYEGVHQGIHSKSKLIPKKLQVHHMEHHKKYPMANYGVITDKWDLVFRTKR